MSNTMDPMELLKQVAEWHRPTGMDWNASHLCWVINEARLIVEEQENHSE